MNTFLKIVGVIIACIISPIWNGYVFCVLWSWFIVTQFGLPQLSIPSALGISLLIRFTTYDYKKGENKGLVESIVIVFAVPLFILIVGKIITLFM